jgi:hypothetical protein
VINFHLISFPFRDQFNLLVNELSSMVSTNSRKMDKSTVSEFESVGGGSSFVSIFPGSEVHDSLPEEPQWYELKSRRETLIFFILL